MAKTVIHLFGASGSGTSTLGRYICEKIGGFFMDTDDYYWMPVEPPYTVKRDIPDRLKLMRKDIEDHDVVVISGSLVNWGDELIPDFTLAIRVVIDPEIRLERLRQRERGQFGSRIDEGGDMHEVFTKFIEWAALYETAGVNIRSKAMHDEWEKLLKCPIVRVDGAKPLEDNYRIIKEYL